MSTPTRAMPVLAALLMLTPVASPAQIGRVLDRAKAKAEVKIDRKVDRMIDGAIDCALGDAKCVEDAKKEGKPVVITNADGEVIRDPSGNPITDQDAAAAAGEEPGGGVWRNYDFVPGDTVWYATDFSNERVGRIPASQVEFVGGNLEIVERAGKRLLEAKSESDFRVQLPAILPQQFTVEFMLETGAPHIATSVFTAPLEGTVGSFPGDYLYLFANPGIYRKGQSLSSTNLRTTVGNLTPIKLQVDGEYAILYVGSTRAAQVPTASFPRSDVIQFKLNANSRFPAYISDIVVAVGLDPLYDGLMRAGEVTTYGILFDVDSHKLRPESTPTLQAMAEMLEGHPELRLEIVGHTDATGEDEHNLDLSKRRAAAVVAWLRGEGIDDGRLMAAGKGETAPVGDNATPEGRQQNRRVVIRRVE
jgi:outer membrane protein OmpA-like peptidoglycan-associated protein